MSTIQFESPAKFVKFITYLFTKGVSFSASMHTGYIVLDLDGTNCTISSVDWDSLEDVILLGLVGTTLEYVALQEEDNNYIKFTGDTRTIATSNLRGDASMITLEQLESAEALIYVDDWKDKSVATSMLDTIAKMRAKLRAKLRAELLATV